MEDDEPTLDQLAHATPDPAHHPLLDAVNGLRERAVRDRVGRFFVSGIRFVDRADAHHWVIDELVVSRRLLRSRHGRALARRLEARGTRTTAVSPEVFRALSPTRRASGLGAVIRTRAVPLARQKRRGRIGWIATDGIRSPGNLGTLMRTAASLGAAGLIAVGDRVDPWDPAVVRASMGAIFGLRIAVAPSMQAVATWAKRVRCPLVCADGNAQRTHVEADLRGPLVLYLGHEGAGASPAANAVIERRVALPMPGGGDSLNVAVAGSVMLYEVWRQTAARR